MVDAGRRRFRCRNSAHRDRQDSKNGAARPVQGLRAAERSRVTIYSAAKRRGRPRVPYPALQYNQGALQMMHNCAGTDSAVNGKNHRKYLFFSLLIETTSGHFVATRISLSGAADF